MSRTTESGPILKAWAEEMDAVQRRLERAHDALRFGICLGVKPLPASVMGVWIRRRRNEDDADGVWVFSPVSGFLDILCLTFAAPYDAEARQVLTDHLLEREWIYPDNWNHIEDCVRAWCTVIIGRLVMKRWDQPQWWDDGMCWAPMQRRYPFLGVDRRLARDRTAGQRLVATGSLGNAS